MKKGKAMIVSLAVCMGLLGGCGSTDPARMQIQARIRYRERYRVRKAERKNAILHLPSEPISPGFPHREWFRSWQRNLKAETGIKIDFQITPDDQWRDLLKTKLDSGEAYDIMCVDADPLSLYTPD